MHRKKFKYESKQRALTQKLSKQELNFICTALALDDIYPPTKFITIARIALEIKYENKQRAITQKISK